MARLLVPWDPKRCEFQLIPRYIITCVLAYIHTHKYMHTYISSYVRTYTHACICVCTYMQAGTRTSLPQHLRYLIHTCTHKYMHTHTHTFVHTYIHTPVCVCLCVYTGSHASLAAAASAVSQRNSSGCPGSR